MAEARRASTDGYIDTQPEEYRFIGASPESVSFFFLGFEFVPFSLPAFTLCCSKFTSIPTPFFGYTTAHSMPHSSKCEEQLVGGPPPPILGSR